MRWSESSVERRYPGGRFLQGRNGVPSQIVAWPGDRTSAIGRTTSFYFQDRWLVTPTVSINAGLRATIHRGSVPAGRTIFATHGVAPRVGVSWALGATSRTALKAHAGRYFDTLLGERVAFMDIQGLNQTVIYQISPGGSLVEVFRSAPPAARGIDRRIRHSHMDQFVAGLEHVLFGKMLLQAQYIRRNYDDFMAMVDTGLQWAPIEVQDPGPDGQLGTADDGGFFTAYRNVNPGASFLFYTNPADAHRRYDAVQVAAVKRSSQNWQLHGSYTWSRTVGTVGNGDNVNAGLSDTGEIVGNRTPSVFANPNGVINAKGRAPYDLSELKVLGAYRVSALGGALISGVLWRHSGNTWERSYIFNNILIPFSAQTVRLEPRGSRRLPSVWNLDVRAEKLFTVGKSSDTVGIVLDVYNATNQGSPLNIVGVSSSQFGQVVTRAYPRMGRLLLRYAF
jgi:hypothetical protein